MRFISILALLLQCHVEIVAGLPPMFAGRLQLAGENRACMSVSVQLAVFTSVLFITSSDS